MKAGLWKTDWFLGAVVVLVVLAFNRASDLIPSLEQKAYDLGVQSTSRQPSDKVAGIALDDPSIANIRRWPRARCSCRRWRSPPPCREAGAKAISRRDRESPPLD